jgi:trk system potassium uptake protein
MSQKFRRLRANYYKRIFLMQDFLKDFARNLVSAMNLIFLITSLFFFGLAVYQVGFELEDVLSSRFFGLHKVIFLILFFSKYIPEILKFKKRKLIGWIYEGTLFVVSFIILIPILSSLGNEVVGTVKLSRFVILFIISLSLILSELYKLTKLIDSIRVAPSLLFAASFLLIIFVGSGLLMLPRAHTGPITYLDAMFTSASAVCVTGLTVVDTATTFTMLGKIIIICLIQIGGLGIMAFTGFFSYAFTGSVSFKDRLLLKDIVSADTLNDIFRLITKIILLTFLTEAIAAFIIYVNVDDFVGNRVLFAVFHSVSAFCNAGFSTLSSGLASPEIHGNYWVISTISMLIIMGGIGFPVLIMAYKYLKQVLLRLFFLSKRNSLPAKMISRNIGNTLAINTTLILIVVGAIFYYLFEKSSGMVGLSATDKFVEAFFGSVSARTAGFNMIDITKWTYPTIFFMIFLMWIGASPGSTGGGIKTTTFAVAALAAYNFIHGRNQIKIKYSVIGNDTISRVLVVIALSIVVIFIGFMGLLISDPLKNPVHLLFECVSAFATVGLSIVGTSTISGVGQIIIICLMFVGRVGPLALLTGMFVSHRIDYGKYPEQNLTIN